MFKRRKMFIMIFTFTLCMSYGIKVNASTLSDTTDQSYMFVSTDGEVCGANVKCLVTQDYSEYGAQRTYTTRYGCTWMTYAATFFVPMLSATNPVFVNSSGTTIKSFSPWNLQQCYLPSGAYCAYTKNNTTSVTYYNVNNYYIRHSYMIGNTDYVGVPYYSGSVKVRLGN